MEMKSVITKIFNGEFDENVHSDFIKFSKGIFADRYLTEGKKQKDKWSVKTSAEFANYFVRKCLENCDEKVNVKGAIICTSDLSGEIDFEIENVKRYMGIRQFIVNTDVEAEKILKLMDKYPRAFYALSFATADYGLKIKAKAPKSGKPGAKGEAEPKADFCFLKTSDTEIINDLFFDVPSFNEIKIKHVIEINEIEIPSGAKTPEEMRERAVRKGRIIRKIIADEERKESVKEFAI